MPTVTVFEQRPWLKTPTVSHPECSFEARSQVPLTPTHILHQVTSTGHMTGLDKVSQWFDLKPQLIMTLFHTLNFFVVVFLFRQF